MRAMADHSAGCYSRYRAGRVWRQILTLNLSNLLLIKCH
jgi:hypothetical protein